MLTAMGADPSKCGYTQQQVEHCQGSFLHQPIHQEYAGAQHLAYLLVQKGILDPQHMKAVTVKEKSEVMKIRINQDRSPVEGIPVSFRKPLFDILCRYVDGVVRREGRQWIKCGLTDKDELLSPYPFESSEMTLQREICS
jgi:hypothetical protein